MTFAYNLANGYPFSTYGENALLLVQGWVLLYLLASYNNKLNAVFFASAAVYTGACAAIFGGFVSLELMALGQALTVPVISFSKIPQIMTNFSNKSTGQLAFITCFLNFLGCVARIFTTLTEVSDLVVLSSVVISTVLNGILFLQVVMYWGAQAKADKKNK
eukprot:CAMPEP_0175139942 /NCGR_PEP_ID=MMETSP0087-20121206/11193_1 /TAXON_ID=136419 /ORGANISM="Unknown Unknown, Strain D1" /LENGTH=160 /DNA_ID=CAMNT_0016423029 /DNA_START=257 /DNA_END=739 /DNA_ORIENTATION=+